VSRAEQLGPRFVQKFTQRYGPWALVAGASEGVGSALAEALAECGLDVVLVARRQAVLADVAAGISERTGARTRTLAIDLAEPDASSRIFDAVADIEIGYVAYCAGADPAYRPFLDQAITSAEALVRRNCVVPMQLVHHFSAAMVERGRGGVLLFSSGAGLVGMPNTAVYGGTKAFDLVLAEGLWAELKPHGVDVLGLVLGETDTPALRRLRAERGLSGPDQPARNATPVSFVVDVAMKHLANGPTRMVGTQMRVGERMLSLLPRNSAARFAGRMSARAMGEA
jgi:short-subunit dehydrogenase